MGKPNRRDDRLSSQRGKNLLAVRGKGRPNHFASNNQRQQKHQNSKDVHHSPFLFYRDMFDSCSHVNKKVFPLFSRPIQSARNEAQRCARNARPGAEARDADDSICGQRCT